MTNKYWANEYWPRCHAASPKGWEVVLGYSCLPEHLILQKPLKDNVKLEDGNVVKGLDQLLDMAAVYKQISSRTC